MKAEELDADLHAALVTAHIGPNLVLFLLVMALLYDEMRSIECQMEAQTAGMDADAMIAELDQLDQRANHLRVPTAYANASPVVLTALNHAVEILCNKISVA